MNIDELNNTALQVIGTIVDTPYDYCSTDDREQLVVVLGEVSGVLKLVDKLKKAMNGEYEE